MLQIPLSTPVPEAAGTHRADDTSASSLRRQNPAGQEAGLGTAIPCEEDNVVGLGPDAGLQAARAGQPLLGARRWKA